MPNATTSGTGGSALAFRNWTFRTKLTAAFLSILMISCALGGTLYIKLHAARDGIVWTTHTYKVLRTLDGIMASMVDQETGLRGYLLADGNAVFLEPFTSGVDRFDAQIEQLRQLTQGDPREMAKTEEIREQGLSWRVNHAEQAIALMKDPATAQAAQELEISGAGKAQLDAIRALVAEFQTLEEGLLAQRAAVLDQNLRDGDTVIYVATGLGVLVALFAGFLMVHSIDLPLRKTIDVLSRLAAGNLAVDAGYDGRRDEVGQIGKGLVSVQRVMRDAQKISDEVAAKQEEQKAVVDALFNGLDRLASLDLTYRIEATVNDRAFPEDYEALREAFNGLAETLTETLRHLNGSAEDVNGRTSQMEEAAHELSRRTENQAATLEQSAAALEQMSESVQSSARNAADAEEQTRDNHRIAQETGSVVRQAVDAMERIQQRSDEITQIISVIDDIAFQTNLLALNAGVEAARAGEAGRGFSVVASEVRQLAQRSADSAQQIKDLILSSSAEVESGGQLVADAGSALEDILNRVSKVTERIADISTASQEQAQGLKEVNVGMRELDTVTQQNAAMAQEFLGSSGEMASVSKTMLAAVRRFDLGGDGTDADVPDPQPVDLGAADMLPSDFDPEPEMPVLAETGTGRPVANAWTDF